jgi:hypothetical protein
MNETGNRLVVFARGPAGNLVHKYYDNGWSGWIPLGTEMILSAPAAVVNETGQKLVVFARGSAGNLVHKYYENGVWSGWIPLGNETITTPPAAVVRGNRLVVFAGVNTPSGRSILSHKYFAAGAGAWTDWISLGMCVESTPTAMNTGPRLAVYANECGGHQLSEMYWDDGLGRWQFGHTHDAEVLRSGPGAVLAGDRLTVFAATGGAASMKHRFYDPAAGAWTGWIDLGGSFFTPF